MRTGLVMEGGAMRGMFTCGVIDVFLENNIVFDGAVGVSAGACFGCNFKSKQIGRALRYNKKYCKDRRYVSYLNILKEGNIFGTDFCYRKIPFELDIWDDKSFVDNPMEFYTVATDAITGKAKYHKCTDGLGLDIEYMRASASMPIASRLVEIGDEILTDGGVADSIPIKFFESIGYDRNVIILTQPKGYIKKKNPLMPLARLMYGKYPNLIKAMADRHISYNETTAYIDGLEKEDRVLVIRPDESLNIPHTTKNPDELERVYQIGRKVALDRLDEIRAYLSH